MKPILERLLTEQVSSCDCGTKTPEHKYHSTECAYRILEDARVEIKRLGKIEKAANDLFHWHTMVEGGIVPDDAWYPLGNALFPIPQERNDSMRCIVTKQIKWHMGHRVPSHKGKCRSMHGHTYGLTVEVVGRVDESAGTSDEGMVIDFGDVKSILMSRIHNQLDHGCMLWVGDSLTPALRADRATNLIDVPFIPTAENIAKWCFEQLDEALHIPGCRRLLRVTVHETPTSSAEYSKMMDDWWPI